MLVYFGYVVSEVALVNYAICGRVPKRIRNLVIKSVEVELVLRVVWISVLEGPAEIQLTVLSRRLKLNLYHFIILLIVPKLALNEQPGILQLELFVTGQLTLFILMHGIVISDPLELLVILVILVLLNSI